MIVKQIIEYFRALANRHPNIECYRTGERYEFNETRISYPLLFLHTDFSVFFGTEEGLLDTRAADFRFRLSILTKSREAYDQRPENQIKMQNLFVKQDEDIDSMFTILLNIVQKAVVDFNEDYLNQWTLQPSSSAYTLKRVSNDDCDGWYIDLLLRVGLPCPDEVFGEDIIDLGVNKTQYSEPININPLS